jgi:hypothetical protein
MSLFDLDAPAASGPHRLTLDLSPAQWAALQGRAKASGLPPEDVLRALLDARG